MTDKELLTKYAENKLQIKSLEAELEELYPAVLEFLKSQPDETPVELKGYGVFSLVSKNKWEYSEATMDIAAEFTKAKAREQADGTAKLEPGQIVKFYVKE